MKGEFIKPDVVMRTGDGRNGQLLTYLIYRDSRGRLFRTLTKTDGGSTPWFIWWLIPPFGSKDWKSFVLHDGCYHDCIEMWEVEKTFLYHKWTPTEAESNWLLDDGLKAQGYGRFKRYCVHVALKYFGWRAFKEDRKAAAVTPQTTLRT